MAKQAALGITLPIKRGNNGYFQQSFDLLTQAKSNLTNLLLTKKGERVMQPNFGSGIHEYVFSPITNNIEANIRGTIEESVQIWLPYIKVESVKVLKQEDLNKIFVSVIFSIRNNVNVSDSIVLAF